MLRALIFLLLFNTFQSATENLITFDPCYTRNSQSILEPAEGIGCIAISQDHLICHSSDSNGKLSRISGREVIAYNPLLRLYLLKSKEKLIPIRSKPFYEYPMENEVATIRINGYKVNRIDGYGNGVDELPRLVKPFNKVSLVGVKCYSAIGITSSEDVVIPVEMLQAFVDGKLTKLGDLGIRLIDEKGKVKVLYTDPYFKENPFQMGDVILEIDGVKSSGIGKVAWQILQMEPSSKHKIVVKRNGKKMTLSVETGIRYGGGFLPDTFLERFGIYFNNELKLIHISEGSIAQKMGLQNGDRLLKVDGIEVNEYKEIRSVISGKETSLTSILFDRDDFQFFITLK